MQNSPHHQLSHDQRHHQKTKGLYHGQDQAAISQS